MPVEDLLEGDFAVQLVIDCDEDGSQAALGMGAQHAESLAAAGRCSDGVGGRAVGVAVLGRAVAGGHAGEGHADFRVAEPGQTLAG